jgi:hypothetical protein
MAAYRSTYRGNYKGIGRMLQRPGMAKATIEAAAKMKPLAQVFSPVGKPPADPHPGLYQGSFEIHYGVKDVKFRGKSLMRPYGRLINVAPHAAAVEYGNKHVKRYAVLRKTLDAAKGLHINV